MLVLLLLLQMIWRSWKVYTQCNYSVTLIVTVSTFSIPANL